MNHDILSSEEHDGVNTTSGANFLCLGPVANVKALRIHDGLGRELFRCLRSEDGDRPLELLPELRRLTYSGNGDVSDAFNPPRNSGPFLNTTHWAWRRYLNPASIFEPRSYTSIRIHCVDYYLCLSTPTRFYPHRPDLLVGFSDASSRFRYMTTSWTYISFTWTVTFYTPSFAASVSRIIILTVLYDDYAMYVILLSLSEPR